MAKINPFKAVRYQALNSKAAALVCPPYDVISPKLEKKLRKLKENAVQIELPSGSPKTKYQNAEKIWGIWRKKGVVQQDKEAAFYIYEQLFNANGQRFSRKGFFCEVELEKPGEGSILRHELTLSKPKEDRLNLLRSLRINTSPVFGIFDDPQKKIGKIISNLSKEKSELEFKDQENVIHKLWICKDQGLIKKIKSIAEAVPILIADGHHRCETAWNYFQESKESGAKMVLFFLCPMNNPGLVIFPTHRILAQKKLASYKDIISKAKTLNQAFSVRESLSLLSLQKHFSQSPHFVVTNGKSSALVRMKSLESIKKLLPGKSESYLKLPLLHIHSLLLPELKKEDFIYSHQAKEAVSLAKKKKSVALLVPPSSIQELYQVVRSGELMPQKSTYFYPKIITGLLFRTLQP